MDPQKMNKNMMEDFNFSGGLSQLKELKAAIKLMQQPHNCLACILNAKYEWNVSGKNIKKYDK